MNDDSVNPRNPTGIKLTQEQMDESFRERYWAFAIRYGLQYYVAGRFATANRFTPICANNGQGPEPSYNLSLPPIDRLVGLLFKASNANPKAFLHEITDEQGMGSTYYQMIKASLFGRAPTQDH